VKSVRFINIVTILIAWIIFLWGVLSVISCDESLPPREDPKVLFKSSVSSLYEYTPWFNGLIFFTDVTNIYHETVQDTAFVNGTLEVILKRDPQYRKTLTISQANLFATPMYTSSTGCFTIDPQKSVTFTNRWEYVDDNQVNLTESVFSYSKDTLCKSNIRAKSLPETFILKGWIQISKWGGTVLIGPTEISVFYVTPYYVDRYCPPY
jgi:hypothetical protein